MTWGPIENHVSVPVEERQSSNRPTVTFGVHASSLRMQKAMTYHVHTHYIQHIHYACGFAYVTVTSNWPPYIHSLTRAQYRSDLKMSLTEMWIWIKPLDRLKQYRNMYKKWIGHIWLQGGAVSTHARTYFCVKCAPGLANGEQNHWVLTSWNIIFL